MGLFYALLVNDASAALPLAVFFELFWLDLFPIGGYQPPNPSFSYLMLLTLAAFFGWSTPSHLLLPLALSLPFAYVTPLLEGRLRKLRIPWNSLVLRATRTGGNVGATAGLVMWQSLALALSLDLLFWVLATILLGGIFFLLDRADLLPIIGELSWAPVYLLAGLGALLALRIRRAYVVFLSAVVIVTVASIFI